MEKSLPNSIGQAHRPAVGLSGLQVDIDSMLCNLNSAFNPLHRDCLLDYHVRSVNSSQVCMSVVMPNELLSSFSQMLESMGGFFRVVNNKARSSAASIRIHDLDAIAKREQITSDFKKDVCSLFDKFISQGFAMNDAVKSTNNALKAKNHPWASFYIVQNTLRAAGRLRRSKDIREVN